MCTIFQYFIESEVRQENVKDQVVEIVEDPKSSSSFVSAKTKPATRKTKKNRKLCFHATMVSSLVV